jgi:hypothetical protein
MGQERKDLLILLNCRFTAEAAERGENFSKYVAGLNGRLPLSFLSDSHFSDPGVFCGGKNPPKKNPGGSLHRGLMRVNVL